MIAGILFQLFSMAIFVLCLVDLLIRSSRQGTLPFIKEKFGILLPTIVFVTTCIYIRSVYLVVELFDGWRGKTTTHEKYFIFFDGVMMVLAAGAFNVSHPSTVFS
jgi:hypothetical protein